MKKIFLAMVLLCFVTTVNAQVLTISNNSCTDVNIVVFAADGINCGPLAMDQSDVIPVSAGGGASFNFNGTTAAPGFRWISTPAAGDPSTNFSSGTFNFFNADVWTACSTGPTTTPACPSGMVDGTTVDNINCGPNSSVQFTTTQGTSCGTCCYCYSVWNAATSQWDYYVCADAPITATFTMSGSNWNIDIY